MSDTRPVTVDDLLDFDRWTDVAGWNDIYSRATSSVIAGYYTVKELAAERRIHDRAVARLAPDARAAYDRRINGGAA